MIKAGQRGFTLVEISIVLVVIGLILGGILIGRDLIRSAELRRDITQIEKINVATQTFKNKYNCLPGDCARASDFFSDQDNGNGDGYIRWGDFSDGNTGSGYLLGFSNPSQLETGNFFDQLALAGMIDVSPFDYGAVNAAPSNTGLLALPSSPGFYIFVACPYYMTAEGCNVARLGVFPDTGAVGERNYQTQTNAIGTPRLGVYTPIDAYYIDHKLDDGAPQTGLVLAATNARMFDGGHWDEVTPAATNSCVSNAAGNPYLLTDRRKLCGLTVQLAF